MIPLLDSRLRAANLVAKPQQAGRVTRVIGLNLEVAGLDAAIGDAVAIGHAASMDEAVAVASAMAQPGDAVLLSPACSSFDMFRDYKHRGEVFVAAVRALARHPS